jgi:hypothetical protein
VAVAQYDLATPKDDVTTALRTLRLVSSPTLPAGRSYRGSVLIAWPDSSIFQPMAPDTDETSQKPVGRLPTKEIFSHVEVADGRVWFTVVRYSAPRGRSARAGADARLAHYTAADLRPPPSPRTLGSVRGDHAHGHHCLKSMYRITRNSPHPLPRP